MSDFTVAGASLATEDPLPPLEDRGFEHARAFQNRVVEWIHELSSPVAVLRAPTGAGKTATFYELIADRDMTLLVYPTNALLRQQRERFEEDGLDVSIVTGNTLKGHGHERTENLVRHVNAYATDHDVVLTNPDILQAALQALYRGGDVMRFFNFFDSIVYDEFHFYDALAASGLLLQIKIIAERHAEPKILLASATPNEDFVSFLDEEVGLPIRGIEATYAGDGDEFRKAVAVHRHANDRILDQRDEVASALKDEIDSADDLQEPRAVVVFNSAKDSNVFHDFLYRDYPDVFDQTVKDNGFDTKDETVDLDDEEFCILNTTSKGEVGLDYDVRTMYMEAPPGSSDFLQRFGRAGRRSEAVVHVFGLGQGPWGDDVNFPRFATQIYEGLEVDGMDYGTLADLVGFRAALAIADRETDRGWFNQELRADFEDSVTQFGRWRGFIADVEREHGQIKEGFEPGKYEKTSPEAKLLKFARECFDAFRGLRGQSLPASIKYPRGDQRGLTTYDLTTTLRNYDIERVEGDNVFVVHPADDGIQSTVTARLPAYESEPTQYDRPTWKIEDQLQTKIHRQIDQVELNDTLAVHTGLLHRFFDLLRIVDAIVPSRITTAQYEIHVETRENAPTEIDVRYRDP
jgi:CRISPR-associated endonuclease/helicase Cas3